MKKQLKQLSLNKKTISNLQPLEMEKKVGGRSRYITCRCYGGNTKNGNTCADHNTCNSCVNTCVNYTCI
jgi:hypothetical protein